MLKSNEQIFIYEYKVNKKIMVGEIAAKDISMAKTILRRQKTDVISIKRKSISNYGGKVNSADIALFTRQMSTMLSSGIALLTALNVIIEGS